MDNNFVVTFARGFGSGGKEIASKLAHELGINCYENRILTLASQLSGLDEEVFKAVDEKVRTNGGFSNFLRGLPKARGYITWSAYMLKHPAASALSALLSTWA